MITLTYYFSYGVYYILLRSILQAFLTDQYKLSVSYPNVLYFFIY